MQTKTQPSITYVVLFGVGAKRYKLPAHWDALRRHMRMCRIANATRKRHGCDVTFYRK